MDGACSTYEKDEKCIQILVKKPEGERPLGRPSIDGEIILRRILGKQSEKVWSGFIWLRIGTSGRFL